MATWGSAFLTALKIVIMSLVWGIIGLAMIVFGILMLGMPYYGASAPPLPGNVPTGLTDITSILVGGVLVLIGYVILVLGTLASFLKYSAEYYAREVKREITYTPPPTAPY